MSIINGEDRMRRISKVKYMQTMLGESLLSLLGRRPIEKITVTEICKLAEVNRGTFYAYFRDPADLLSKIEANLYEKFVAISVRPADLKKETIKHFFRSFFDLFYDNKDLVRVLFGDFGDRKFLLKCAKIGYEAAITDWQKKTTNVDQSYLEYTYAYIYNGCLGIVELWIKNDFRESPAEMAELVNTFFTDSLVKYII
jgi:hypothetical protein